MTYQHIGVVGGGAWGTALAISAARAGRQVTLWEHDAANAAQLATKRESLFLPGVRIDDAIAVTRDAAALARAEALLVVVPAQAMRAVVTALAPVVAARHAADRLRQRHRGRHARLHVRHRCRMRAQGGAGDPLRTELRGRRRARPADRSDARGA